MADQKLKNAKAIFILGGPGSGKGTQCDKIVAECGYKHLSSGDLLREECASGSARGKELSAIMESGKLVSLDVVLKLIKEAMEKCKETSYFLIDGYPREVEQGVRFEKEVCPCECVISLDVSEKVMTERLLGRGKTSGRVDDNAETIKKRLQTFNESTKPVIAHYEKQNKLIHIDASKSIDEVFADLMPKLKSKVK